MLILFDTVTTQAEGKNIKQLTVSIQSEKGMNSEGLKGFPIDYLFMSKLADDLGRHTFIPSLIEAMKYNQDCPDACHQSRKYYLEDDILTKELNELKQEIINTINDRIDEYKKLINTKLPKPYNLTVNLKVGLSGNSLRLITI